MIGDFDFFKLFEEAFKPFHGKNSCWFKRRDEVIKLKRNRSEPEGPQRLRFAMLFAGVAVALLEFLDAAFDVHQTLSAGIEGMAVAANIQTDFGQRGAGFDGAAANTNGSHFMVLGMGILLGHKTWILRGLEYKGVIVAL